jgi:hypothetical protein
MEKERLNRLSHWWREVETASDEEALHRKLHLMEAEIRHTLRGAREVRKRQGLRNAYAALMLAAVLLLTLGVQHITNPVLAPQLAADTTGITQPAAPIVVIPAPTPAETPAAAAIPAHSRAAHPAIRHASGRKPVAAFSPAKPAPAPATVAPSAAPAPQPKPAVAAHSATEPGLDPLALLSKLESEFEK